MPRGRLVLPSLIGLAFVAVFTVVAVQALRSVQRGPAFRAAVWNATSSGWGGEMSSDDWGSTSSGGPSGDMCTVTEYSCAWWNSCDLTFDPSTCGDPPPGCVYGWQVTVTCGSQAPTVTATTDTEKIDVPPGGSCECASGSCTFTIADDSASPVPPSCQVSCVGPGGEPVQLIDVTSSYPLICPEDSSSTSVSTSTSTSTTSASTSSAMNVAFYITHPPGSYPPGSTVPWSITVLNGGSSSVSFDGIQATLPQPPLQGVTANGGTLNPQAGTITWPGFTVGPFSSAAFSMSALIPQTVLPGTVITAVAQLLGTSMTATDTVSVSPPPSSPGCIEITKKAWNFDDTPWNDQLPDFGFTAQGEEETYPAVRVDTDLWSIEGVPPGSYTVRESTVPQGWVQLGIAAQEGVSVSVSPGKPCATAEFRNKKSPPDLKFSVSVAASPNPIRRTEETTVTVTVGNTTNSTPKVNASNVAVGLTLEAPLAGIAGSAEILDAEGNVSGQGTVQGGGVSWTIPFLGDGESATVRVRAHIPPADRPGLQANAQRRATATAPGTSNFTTIRIDVQPPCIRAEKRVLDWRGIEIPQPHAFFSLFRFVLDGGSQELSPSSDGSALFQNLSVGEHRLGERTPPTGWTDDGVSPPEGRVTLAEGDCPTVTITNRQRPPAPQIVFQQIAIPQQVPAGDVVHYTIFLGNTGGPAPATDVTVAVPPLLAEFVPGSAVDPGFSYNAATRTLRWAGLTLNPGDAHELGYSLRVPPTIAAGTVITTTARALLPSGPIAAPAAVTVRAAPAGRGCIRIGKQLFNPLGVPFLLGNGLPNPLALPFMLPNPLPAFPMTILRQGIPNPVGQSVHVTGGQSQEVRDLEPGPYRVTEEPMSGWRSMDEPGGLGAQLLPIQQIVNVVAGLNCAQLQFRNRMNPGQPRFTIAKTDLLAFAPPGAVLPYTIVVRNDSQVDARDVRVTDVLPPELTYVAAQGGSNRWYDQATRTVIWDIAQLPAGQMAFLGMAARVNPLAPNLWPIRNTAAVNGGPQSTDLTVVVRPAVTGCIEILKRVITPFNTILPLPGATFLVDGDVAHPQVTDGAGRIIVPGVAPGSHLITEVQQPLTPFPMQLMFVLGGPVVNVVPGAACAKTTFVNRQVLPPVGPQTCEACGGCNGNAVCNRDRCQANPKCSYFVIGEQATCIRSPNPSICPRRCGDRCGDIRFEFACRANPADPINHCQWSGGPLGMCRPHPDCQPAATASSAATSPPASSAAPQICQTCSSCNGARPCTEAACKANGKCSYLTIGESSSCIPSPILCPRGCGARCGDVRIESFCQANTADPVFNCQWTPQNDPFGLCRPHPNCQTASSASSASAPGCLLIRKELYLAQGIPLPASESSRPSFHMAITAAGSSSPGGSFLVNDRQPTRVENLPTGSTTVEEYPDADWRAMSSGGERQTFDLPAGPNCRQVVFRNVRVTSSSSSAQKDYYCSHFIGPAIAQCPDYTNQSLTSGTIMYGRTYAPGAAAAGKLSCRDKCNNSKIYGTCFVPPRPGQAATCLAPATARQCQDARGIFMTYAQAGVAGLCKQCVDNPAECVRP